MCELTLQAAALAGRSEPALQERVAFFVGQFLTYFKSGNVQIILDQLESSCRKCLAQGMTISSEDTEEQHRLILQAFSGVVEDDSELPSSRKAHLIKQLERSAHTVAVLSKLVHSRLLLEQLDNQD